MEVVNIFNKELKSILDAKLPVSRHKMSLITKSAMKALKFYKHVVQSVEKFIAKCNCDYKVPGLYVIDAIVRQSKHQYCDKDVFVPRFMRNIVTTFIYLSQCDPKDVPSIERVLRLWQQNGVFPTDLVESLLEIVYDSSDHEKITKAATIVTRLVNDWNALKGKPEEKFETFMPSTEILGQANESNEESNNQKTEGGLIDSVTKLLTKFQSETGQDVSAEIDQIKNLHRKIVEQSALLAQGQMIDAVTLSQLHQSMEELTKKAAKAAAVQQSKLAMLSNDDNKDNIDTSNELEFVEQLQQMVDTLAQTRALQVELRQAIEERTKYDESQSDNNNDSIDTNNVNDLTDKNIAVEDQDLRILPKDDDFDHSVPINSDASYAEDVDLRMLNSSDVGNSMSHKHYDINENSVMYHENYYNNNNNHNNKLSPDGEHFPKYSSAATGNIKKSRSSSRDTHKRRRSHSHTRSPKRRRSTSREARHREKKAKEISRRKYQPSLKSGHIGIISHTVFIGHLNKHLSESKLKSMFEDFGEIKEFNMIPPRGCAFVTYMKRKSAYKAVTRLHEQKFEGRELKVAWAPNKGIKDDKDLKDNWVESEGCTYLPVEIFPINRVKDLIDGGAEIDDDSLPEEVKVAIEQFEKEKSETLLQGMGPNSMETMISVAAEVANNPMGFDPAVISTTADPTMPVNFYPQSMYMHPIPPPPPPGMLPPGFMPYPPHFMPPPPPGMLHPSHMVSTGTGPPSAVTSNINSIAQHPPFSQMDDHSIPTTSSLSIAQAYHNNNNFNNHLQQQQHQHQFDNDINDNHNDNEYSEDVDTEDSHYPSTGNHPPINRPVHPPPPFHHPHHRPPMISDHPPPPPGIRPPPGFMRPPPRMMMRPPGQRMMRHHMLRHPPPPHHMMPTGGPPFRPPPGVVLRQPHNNNGNTNSVSSVTKPL